MDVASPLDQATGAAPSIDSFRARWSSMQPWKRPGLSDQGLTNESYTLIAIVALAITALVQLARLAGSHDLGSGGTWLLLQLIPGLAAVIWVSDVRASSLALYSWVGSTTVITLVGMVMAFTGFWHPMSAYAIVGVISLVSLSTFVVRHRSEVEWPRLGGLNSRTAVWTGWLPLIGLAISLVSSRPHPAGPVPAGLIALVWPTWFIGLACIVVAFVAAIALKVRPWASVLAGSVVVIASQAFVYGTPTVPSAARHIGIIRYILANQRVDPVSDIYQTWSGMFTGQAWLISVSGIQDAFTVATWWPIIAVVTSCLAIRAVAGKILSPLNAWVASGIFVLANSLNTVYYAPQVLAFAPGMAIVAILLAPNTAESSIRARLRIWSVLPIGCAVVVEHQITPFIVAAALTVLVLGRAIKPWWSPLLVFVPAVTWMLLNLNVLRRYITPGALGDVFKNVAPPVHPPAALEQPLISVASFLVPAAALVVLGMTALVMLFRAWDRTALTLVAAAVSPLLLSLGTDYGGEGVFRITLFAVPWLAILALWSPPVRHGVASSILGRSRVKISVVAITTTAFFAVSVLGQTGMDWARVLRSGAIKTDSVLGSKAPDGAQVLYLGSPNAGPGGQSARYQDIYYSSRDQLAAPGATGYPTTQGSAYDPRSDLSALTEKFRKVAAPAHYLFVSTQIGAYDERYGNQSFADFRRLEAAVRVSPQWRIVYRTSDAQLYRLASEK